MSSLLDRAAARFESRLPRALGTVTGFDVPGREVVLTYDDGPTPGETDAVLSALAEHDARATFFVLVNRCRTSPGLLAEVQAAGHEIALHGPDHQRVTRFDAATMRQRTRDARRELEDLAGTEVRWFRPPYGRQGLTQWRVVRQLGLTTVLWGPSLNDWHAMPDQQRLHEALRDTIDGAVVLAHDGFASVADGVDDGPDPGVDRYALSSTFLAALADRGLRAVTVGEADLLGQPVLAPRFRL